MGVPGNANALLLKQAAAAAGGYQISRSVRLNAPDSAYLSRTPGTAGNRKTWTWAGWVKRSALSYGLFEAGTTNNITAFIFNTNSLMIQDYQAGFVNWTWTTNAVFRDFSAWYNIVVAYDTTQASSANAVKIYVNGTEQVVTFSTNSSGAYSQNRDSYVNSTSAHRISTYNGVSNFGDMYLADIHFIDGQALDPSSFGEFDTNGVWQPMAYTGSYGTNGFRLPFSDNSAATATTLGKDSAGSNNWTPNNLSVTAGAGNDSLVDSPMNYGTDTGAGGEVRGNYATLNPLSALGNVVLANGSLDYQATEGSTFALAGSTVGVSSGKWYWEVTIGPTVGPSLGIGVFRLANPNYSTFISGTDGGIGFYHGTANYIYYWNGSAQVSTSYTLAACVAGDIVSVALDLNNGGIYFAKNGSWGASGNPATQTNPALTGLSGTYAGGVSLGALGVSAASFNFGQRPFAYTAPSGFKALTTANLPTPLIEDGSTAMDVKLYTGNGSTQTISGLNFSPDFVWLKARSAVDRNIVTDIVRGVTNTLNTDDTRSEASATEASQVTAYTSTGFTVGSNGNVNGSSVSFVAWTWDAGTSTVSNTAGSITSQVRANASAGFSVVTYTGTGANATVGHGLGVAPRFMAIKNRTAFEGWINYHSSIGPTNFLQFNTTNVSSSNSTVFNDTAPTSNVFSVGTIANTNGSAANFVAYCFAPVAGYSAFGSYTGNNSADGPFVYTGFRPRYILIKSSSLGAGWIVYDTARNLFNLTNNVLNPASSGAENADGVSGHLDILSNGFKLRSTDSWLNSNGATYIYAAFAESPFAYARAR
jgi:hypothetical protein